MLLVPVASGDQGQLLRSDIIGVLEGSSSIGCSFARLYNMSSSSRANFPRSSMHLKGFTRLCTYAVVVLAVLGLAVVD